MLTLFVVPKPIRDRLGFRADSDLEIVETLDSVGLKPIEVLPSMIKIDGLWVHSGKTLPSFDLDQAIREDREDRIRKLAGF